MTAIMGLVVALVLALAVLLTMMGWAACVMGGASDVQYDEGEYADTTRDSV